MRFSERVASPAILHPVPVVAAELVEGDPKGPDGEAVDDGVGCGREEAEAEHAELYKEENIQTIQSVFGLERLKITPWVNFTILLRIPVGRGATEVRVPPFPRRR